MSVNQMPPQGGTDPPVTLVGEQVALGPAHKGLLPLLWKWESDLELGALTGDPSRPMTPEAIEKLYARYSAAGPDTTSFVIYERATMRPIGTVGLVSINQLNRTAELGIGIGERDYWGRGMGTEATRLMVDYA